MQRRKRRFQPSLGASVSLDLPHPYPKPQTPHPHPHPHFTPQPTPTHPTALQADQHYLRTNTVPVVNLAFACPLLAAQLTCFLMFFYRVYRWVGGGRCHVP